MIYLSNEAAFDRLFLLISAIANNPNIGANAENDPMIDILKAMQQLDPQCPDWSVHTLRKDIRFLIAKGILPKTPNASKKNQGYRIGAKFITLPTPAKRTCGKRRSLLSDEEIKQLHHYGKSYAEIAKLAGISRSRVGQIVTGD